MNAHAWNVKRLKRARRRLMRPCGTWSPGLVGYKCELRYRHKGRHECVTSLSTDYYTGREVGRTTTRWG